MSEADPEETSIPSEGEEKPPRKFGAGKGLNLIIDPSWDKPIKTDEELEAFFKGDL